MRARQPCDRIEQNDHVAFVLDQALGFFDHHVRNLYVARRRLVERRRDDFALNRTLHVGDFFRALVDQENNQGGLRMILGNRVSDRLQQHGLARAWR